MVQWQNPALEQRLGVINMNISFLMLGLYGWEYLQTLDVEYAVIRGRLAFRWPLIPYVVGRLFLFVFLLLLAIGTNPPTADFTCLPGVMSAAIAADISLGCASTNLMIRTWMIWKDSRLVHMLLLLVALGHWTVLALDVANLQSYQLNGECVVYIRYQAVDVAVLVYSVCYDFTVLMLSLAGLSRSRQSYKSTLKKRLHTQGIIYFVVAVITYVPPAVFSLLNVPTMVSIVGTTALTASTIASCRAVRSFLGLHSSCPRSLTEESVEDGAELTTHIPIQVTLPPTVY